MLSFVERNEENREDRLRRPWLDIFAETGWATENVSEISTCREGLGNGVPLEAIAILANGCT